MALVKASIAAAGRPSGPVGAPFNTRAIEAS